MKQHTNNILVSLGLWIKTAAPHTGFASVRHQDSPHGPASALPGLFWEPRAQLRWYNNCHLSCDADQHAAQLPVLSFHQRLIQRLLPFRQHQLQPPDLACLVWPVSGGVPARHLQRCLPILRPAPIPSSRLHRGEPHEQSKWGLHAFRAGRAGLRKGQDAGGEAEGDKWAHLETPARTKASGGAEDAAAEAEEEQLFWEEATAFLGCSHQAGRCSLQLPFCIPTNSCEKTKQQLRRPIASLWSCSTPAPWEHSLRGALRSNHRTFFHISQPTVLPSAFTTRGCEKPPAYQFAPIAKQPLLPTLLFRPSRRRAQGLLTCRQPGVYCTGKDSLPHAQCTSLSGSGIWICNC